MQETRPSRSLVWTSHRHYLADGFCRARYRKALIPEVRNASSLLRFQFDTKLTERHRELSADAFVTLNVGKVANPFVVPKSILCMRSDYLRAMSQGSFQEEWSHTTSLPDVEPKYIAPVLQWFYTGLIVLSDGTAYIGKNDPKTMNEAVKMFLFADRYDT